MALSLELYLDLTEDSGSLQKALGVTYTHNMDFAKDLRPREIHDYVVLVRKFYEIKYTMLTPIEYLAGST